MSSTYADSLSRWHSVAAVLSSLHASFAQCRYYSSRAAGVCTVSGGLQLRCEGTVTVLYCSVACRRGPGQQECWTNFNQQDVPQHMALGQ